MHPINKILEKIVTGDILIVVSPHARNEFLLSHKCLANVILITHFVFFVFGVVLSVSKKQKKIIFIIKTRNIPNFTRFPSSQLHSCHRGGLRRC